MANKTTNYKLTKPLESEFYDVGVQNENMDKIDTHALLDYTRFLSPLLRYFAEYDCSPRTCHRS